MAAWELHEDDEMYEMYSASVFHGPNLQLTKVNRKHMSEYVCVASNGIPPDESWTIKLLVTCESSEYAQNLTQFVALWGQATRLGASPSVSVPPLVVAKEQTIRTPVGGMARLVCTAESWPRPEILWESEGKQIFDNDEYSTVGKAWTGEEMGALEPDSLGPVPQCPCFGDQEGRAEALRYLPLHSQE